MRFDIKKIVRDLRDLGRNLWRNRRFKKALPWAAGFAVSAVLAFIVYFAFNADSPLEGAAPDERYVASFTGGVISPEDDFFVIWTEPQDTEAPFPNNAWTMRPAAKVDIVWEDQWTLKFSPRSPLKSDTRYQVRLQPASFLKIDGKSPTNSDDGGALEPFVFEFSTRPTLFNVEFEPPAIKEDRTVVFAGTVWTENSVSEAAAEKTLLAKELKIDLWEHSAGKHRFVFKAVPREEGEKVFAVRWDGKSVLSKTTGETELIVPAIEQFAVSSITESGNNTILAVFTSPLPKNADLRGFITMENASLSFKINGNTVEIFNAAPFEGDSELIIKELRDIYGEALAETVSYKVQNKWELPEVRFAGTGVILPSTQGSTFVVETRNISGLIVEAFEIYGNNIVQFLQVNKLSERRELYRVGRPVWTKSFDFEWKSSDKNRFVRRGLDTHELAKKYPDSMFHIRVAFRKRHTHYECEAGHPDFSALKFPSDNFPVPPENNWDNSYEHWEEEGISREDAYEYRKDPCHPAFYMPYYDHNITAWRNVLVSDLGLLAKKTEGGSYFAALSNLRTAKAEAGAELQFLNFQGKVIYSAKSSQDGTFSVDLPNGGGGAGAVNGGAGGGGNHLGAGEPVFLLAKSAAGRAFLKFDDGRVLSTSHFDVSGDVGRQGVKGFIYGERGVWRPGDDIYLTFLLADTKKSLPANHPVRFELEDPRGRITESRLLSGGVDGFYAAECKTAESAPTGDWTARFRVGGSVFNKTVKIETIMPNRLKVKLDFGAKDYISEATGKTALSSEWLHGAKAAGLKAKVEAVLVDTGIAFKTYGDYSFRDPSRIVQSSRTTLFDGTLDGEGRASFDLKLSESNANLPGKLSARFITQVFEPSGAFSQEQFSIEYSPYKRYVGLRTPEGTLWRGGLQAGKEHTASIVLLDAEGRAAPEAVQLEAALYKLDWRWWWERGGDESADWTEALHKKPVLHEAVKAAGGKAQWKFSVGEEDYGRYLVLISDNAGGHAAAKTIYISSSSYRAGAGEGETGGEFNLNLTSDKESYKAGDAITINFPSNSKARALITLEKGGEIIKKEWINCAESQTVYQFQAEKSMTPNIYAHITMLQEHGQTANDLPIRLYGIIPILINDDSTVLKPQISAAPLWEPSSKVSFKVKEAGGRPMSYTAVVVDEGLLGITRFATPNPHDVFYRKEASFLKSWDIFNEVMSAYSGRLETLLAIGGGDDGLDNAGERPKRFVPIVKYFPPARLAAGEERELSFEMGEYIGAVRIMVIAASQEGGALSYGAVERAVEVKSDLMTLVTAPRVLSPNDEALIPVTVFSYKEGRRKVQITLTLEGALGGLTDNSGAPTRGDGGTAGSATLTEELIFEEIGDKTVKFRTKAGPLPGMAKITAKASSNGLKTAQNTVNIEARSTAFPVTELRSKLLQAGESWSTTVKLPGREGTNSAVLELSRTPPLGLERRLGFLISYPHGCIEQTTSAVFPQLFLEKAVRLNAEKLRATRENINAGIKRISGFQTYDGGFSYWPGGGEANEWGTNYAGHFLVMARQSGFAVRDTLLDSWLDFQKKKAVGWTANTANRENARYEALNQAYRLYTLALAGKPDLGAMNRLRDKAGLGEAALWRLAAAYWLAGQRDIARVMTASANQNIASYRELGDSFGSALRDKAMILETLGLTGDFERSKNLLEDVSKSLASDDWLSTQETAYALISILPFLSEDVTAPISLDYGVGALKQSFDSASPIASVNIGSLSGGEAAFSLKNTSPARFYAQIITRGLSEEGAEKAQASGISLSVEYLYGGRPVQPEALAAGENMEIRVTARNQSQLELKEIALVHPLPASWEIRNTRLGAEETSEMQPELSYQDIRDDRVMSYFNLKRGEGITVSFEVSAAYEGKFFTPAIHAYAMYDESIKAVIPGKR